MPHTRLWVHCVWATKCRTHVLNREVRTALFGHIADYSRTNGIFIDTIGGSNDHVHALISLGCSQSISKVVQTIKGESAHWLNQSGRLPFRFAWQDDYFAVSVSESQVEAVRRYINGQIEHHRVKSFAEEYQEFVEKFGFE